jgi:hypothetical protein
MRIASLSFLIPPLLAVMLALPARGQSLPSDFGSPSRLPNPYGATDPNYPFAAFIEQPASSPPLVDSWPTLAEFESPRAETSEETSDGALWPGCDQCPRYGLAVFVGYDAWRGPVDDSWENNGIHTGANFGSRLGQFSDWTGIGGQVGGSLGVYDWSGTEYRIARQDEAEMQYFFTYGLFRKSSENNRWNAALVHDWMFNYNYGALSQSPTIMQWRGQVGYALNSQNEIGVWGTIAGPVVTRDVLGAPRTYKSVDQLNLYWHHKWQAGSDTWLWVGMPERGRLTGEHTLGDYLVGALANCPLNDRVSLYALVTYMHPSATAGPAGSKEEMWNFSIGLSFFLQPNARSSTVAGQCWMPQLPVANNGTFLVDTNRTY